MQYATLLAGLRRVEERIENLDQRFRFVCPSDRDIEQQISWELDRILAPGASLKVFDSD
jgi:hypothetical protein